MRSTRLVAAVVGLAGPDVDFARDVAPLLRESCVDCHGGKEPQQGLSFEKFTNEESARREVGVWWKVREKLARGEMPPAEAPPADRAAVERALRWLDVRLGTSEGSWPIDPGRTTIRRLNRAEYANSVRDLFELDLDVTNRLPADDVGYGFDNIGDVLTLPPLLLEKYAKVAEEVAAAALPSDEMRRSTVRHFEAEAVHCTLDRAVQQQFVDLYSNGMVFTDVTLPRAGEYVVRVRASGDQAGPDPCRMGLHAGAKELGTFDVKSERPSFETVELRATLAGGTQRIGAAFLNDYYHPEDPDPKNRDRNLIVDWLEVEGPLDAMPPTASERRLFVCTASNADVSKVPSHVHSRECAAPILKQLASRAWRRPASELEVARLAGFVDRELGERGAAGFVDGLRHAVAATLLSPNFLFRVELDPAPNDPTRAHALDDFELAARLGYFLWSSLPDDRLESLASHGLLREKRALADEARRMLDDPRASALVTNFAAQWLTLRSLEKCSPDPKLFPTFDDALRESMRLETEMFVEAVVREQRPIAQLLDADFTFVDERLAALYGIAGVKGDRMRRVRVTDPARGGVLTQASLLTLTSNPTRTSPVKRGKFLLERIVGAPPPPPPPGAGVLDESSERSKSASMKERLAQHRAKPECAVCHERMDALGFALEKFGPIGALRSSDGAAPIDDRSTLPDGRAIEGAAGLKRVLLADDSFTRTVAEKLLTYAVGRGTTDDDRRAIAALVASFHGRSPSFAELIGGIVQLDAFRMRRGEAPAAAADAAKGR
jgi:hypothetical protein